MCTIIKFGHLQGKSAPIRIDSNSWRKSAKPCDRETMDFAVRSVKDELRNGRPIRATAESLVEQVRNPRTGESQLEYPEEVLERSCTSCVPHVLTACRVTISSAHLTRFKREEEAFLKRTVADDDTWIRSYCQAQKL